MLPRVVLVLTIISVAARSEPSVTPTEWRGIAAVRITDGRTEAILVPKLGGRIVQYGLVGGANWLWTGEMGAELRGEALFWGGDKTYVGPHTMWPFTLPKTWPPPAPDTSPHETLPPAAGALFTTVSPIWPEYGARIRRDYAFGEKGELVTTHTIEKVSQSRMLGAVWVIAQIVPTPLVFAPLNPKSPYKDNVFWFGWGTPREKAGATVVSPSLLQIAPVTGTVFKLGAHPSKPALAAVKDGLAFVLRSDPQEGQYPEGADGAGLSVEVFHSDLPGTGEYTELELLSPIRRLDKGATLTTRWNIHPVEKDGVRAAVEQLLLGM